MAEDQTNERKVMHLERQLEEIAKAAIGGMSLEALIHLKIESKRRTFSTRERKTAWAEYVAELIAGLENFPEVFLEHNSGEKTQISMALLKAAQAVASME